MATRTEPLLGTNLPLPLRGRGKVRDLYDLDGQLLIVATDRISAFDCILPTGIPRKGEVLTQLSLFWFDFLRDVVPNHLISADVTNHWPQLGEYSHQLQGRSMLVRRATMFPVECVARGYLSGSGWIEYQNTGAVCGIPLPPGLQESARLPEPVFTPATKADSGHDENIPFEAVIALIGRQHADALRTLTLEIYRRAAAHAETCGIIIADTKVEFGVVDGRVTLADEVLTPDSSRFWPADQYAPGKSQPSFDKQFVRDYLLESGWNKQPPAPVLPPEVVEKTASKYQEAHRLLTGRML